MNNKARRRTAPGFCYLFRLQQGGRPADQPFIFFLCAAGPGAIGQSGFPTRGRVSACTTEELQAGQEKGALFQRRERGGGVIVVEKTVYRAVIEGGSADLYGHIHIVGGKFVESLQRTIERARIPDELHQVVAGPAIQFYAPA